MIELLLQAERQLSVGQLDAAERLYWQAIESDPKNSIAVVGLARVALDRGDDRTAYQFARKALEIDPQNAAALRLVARLGEIMSFRGEKPPTERTPSLRWRADGGPALADGGAPLGDGGAASAEVGPASADRVEATPPRGARVASRGLFGRLLRRG